MWIAAEAKVEYARVDLPVEVLKRQGWYLAMQPKGTVPTWIENGRGREPLILTESNSIVAYIASEYGCEHGLYPAEPRDIALAWQWQEYAETTLQPALSPVWWGKMKGSGYPPGPNGAPTPLNEEKLAVQIERALTVFEPLNEWLSCREYVLGNTLTFGDISCGVHANRLFKTRDLAEVAAIKLPSIRVWYDKLLKRPAFYDNVVPFAK